MIMNLFLEKKVKRNSIWKIQVRQKRTRFKLKRVTNRKRLSVFKSNNHIYAQIINDDKLALPMASASSVEKTIRRLKNKLKKN